MNDTPHGGKRQGAGRKANSGMFKEPTMAIRVPQSRAPAIKHWLEKVKAEVDSAGDALLTKAYQASLLPKEMPIPFYQSTVSAGFPSPGDDRIGTALDLNDHLIQNSAATFFVRASGDSMLHAGIHSGDLLIVDRSMTPKSHDVVIAVLNGEMTVKRLITKNNKVTLKAENPEFNDIEVMDDMEMNIWGVVTNVIHSFRG